MSNVNQLYGLTNNNAPKGFMEDGDGNHIRKDRIKPIELERDKLARELFTNAVLVHDEMQALANSMRSKVAAFVNRALSEYDKKLGGTKGNVTLYSFDRKIKIERIGVMQRKSWIGAEGRQEAGAEITVELYGVKPALAADKCLGERTLSRTDFNDMVRISRRDGARDGLDDRLIAQKVLAETLAGGMSHESRG